MRDNILGNILRNIPLAPYTTFKIGGVAEHFVSVQSTEALFEAAQYAHTYALPLTILGGGSNMLISDGGVRGLVIKNEIGGITYRESGDTVSARVGAGVVWDAFVADAVMRGYWGIENLSAIPGTVGATPIQNVGAYGVEVKDVIETVEAFDTERFKPVSFSNDACMFGYRDSYFKHGTGKRFIVTAVTYALSKVPKRILHYKDLANRFGAKEPALAEIRDAVMDIRSAKFPDTEKIGNAGSFFKNPIVSAEFFAALKGKYPGIPAFSERDGTVKVPLGWILEHVLLVKGIREGSVGTYENQALVIVNHGSATAREVDAFAKKIEEKFFDATGIRIEREVNFIP